MNRVKPCESDSSLVFNNKGGSSKAHIINKKSPLNAAPQSKTEKTPSRSVGKTSGVYGVKA